MISYPLRLISTEATVIILQWCGMPVGGTGTVITFGNQQVAITAACSGIEQLEAMMLVGWIIVTVLHRRLSLRLMHFVTILPLILFCNALRLIATLVIFRYWGEVAFSDRIHTWFGVGMVLLVSVLFFQLRFLFVEESESPNSKESNP
jgi:exosortase